ncbi:sensor histidine kinase [Leptolyngbya sp. NIES-2104]|uniref:sensor histidine kinase n=1 Tax=Leptolyngbya sp. NIES-2104 TaxID=1552121 RepID=UPI0006EC6AE9|nr:ATP-binding protein [Leptolyngbya sp. NIES-2104]GAP95881.1 chemotaxis regulator - transmits chemoreceptor signals to flagelllar motor components CheY [Leptolyngbya sp. NIES-2104]
MSLINPVNILLVDDQPENLLALEAVLGKLGENLVQASSGEEALRCLLNRDFAVILLDVQMPGIDGFETASLIRSRARSQHTPIIFLTAFDASDQGIFRGYSLGAVDYLIKPINSDILVSKVSVFVDLFKKTAAVKHQAAQLTAINAELRQSEERFRSLSASSPVGIFVIDPDGRCTYTNPRFQTICGVVPDRISDRSWHRCVHPDDRDQAMSQWNAYLEHGGELSEELRFLTKDDQVRWVHIRSCPMLSQTGEPQGHVGTIEDITERKEAEVTRAQVMREQLARQEAEATNRMKDEFLAVLSHELRTPLNSMLGWVRLLRTKQYEKKMVDRALETIERNAETQSQLIEDILDVSKIIRGKLRLNYRSLQPVAIIQAAIDAVRPQVEAKSIRLTTDFDPDVSHVWGDSTRLQQIVWNLLTNAVKFTPESGEVTIGLQAEDDKTVKISVKDTGIGIEPEFLPYVFDRFRQADSTTTRSHNGLGLGLAIVRHLVELHGGSIEASSPGMGEGATFTVRFPVLQANELRDKLRGGTPIAADGIRKEQKIW